MLATTSSLLLAVAACCFSGASAQDAIENLTALAPHSSYCTGQCESNFTAGWLADAENWVVMNTTDDSFYDLPLNLSCAKAGDLLRWQTLDAATTSTNWSIPSGQSLSRFQYATQDFDGSVVAASAFVLLPYAPVRGDSKFPLLSWSHGTAGIISNCAPSNHKTLYYDWSAPFAFAQQGYAVVGVDYQGMGSVTPRGFEYGAQYTHAADIAFSIAAVKQRLGHLLTDEWVAVGQSEGGGATWRVNQRIAEPGQMENLHAQHYLGSVAIAPATRPVALVKYLLGQPPRPDGGVQEISVYMLKMVSNQYPKELPIENYLTKDGLDRLNNLILKSCVYGASVSVTYMSDAELWVGGKDIWTSTKAAAQWEIDFNRQNLTQMAKPLLVVQGWDDGIVPAGYVVPQFNESCRQNPHVHQTLYTYEGLDHDAVTAAGQPDYLEWIDKLFQGKSMKKGCHRLDHSPVTDNFQTTALTYDAY